MTSPTYRFWMDFCDLEENRDKSFNELLDNLKMRSYPMYYVNNDGTLEKLKIRRYPTDSFFGSSIATKSDAKGK